MGWGGRNSLRRSCEKGAAPLRWSRPFLYALHRPRGLFGGDTQWNVPGLVGRVILVVVGPMIALVAVIEAVAVAIAAVLVVTVLAAPPVAVAVAVTCLALDAIFEPLDAALNGIGFLAAEAVARRVAQAILELAAVIAQAGCLAVAE